MCALMSRRIATRLCSLVISFLVLSIVIFIAEFSFVDKLRYRENGQVPQGQGGALDENVNSNSLSDQTRNPCPKLDHGTAPSASLEGGVLYDILGRRKQHELQVEKSTRELWWYLRNHLKNQHISTYLNTTLRSVRNRYISLQWKYKQLNDITFNSGPFLLNWKYWQRNISMESTSIMKNRIDHLQNPPNCKLAKKLVCRVSKSCGFGCQIHHVSFCFILAYATKRTLILDSTNWRYSPSGWNAVFKPISSTCSEVPSGKLVCYGVYCSQ